MNSSKELVNHKRFYPVTLSRHKTLCVKPKFSKKIVGATSCYSASEQVAREVDKQIDPYHVCINFLNPIS